MVLRQLLLMNGTIIHTLSKAQYGLSAQFDLNEQGLLDYLGK